MRLINITTREVTNFLGRVPPYAVLSHTWGSEEVTFQEFIAGQPQLGKAAKAGWQKIHDFCDIVAKRRPDIGYAWVDTCCIDKMSLSELSETILTMFAWYRDAEICYAFLADVDRSSSGSRSMEEQLEASRWFTRGWTLQELLAPRVVEFFDANWVCVGDKESLADQISTITRIEKHILTDGELSSPNVATKMSWMASRQTTKEEDTAYCLMGIFNVNIDIRYGEKGEAFARLQEAILRKTGDHSILAWDASNVLAAVTSIGALASTPAYFLDAAAIESHPMSGNPPVFHYRGLELDLPILEQSDGPHKHLGVLACYSRGNLGSAIALPLTRSIKDPLTYTRTRSKPVHLPLRLPTLKGSKMFLGSEHIQSRMADQITKCWLQYWSSACELVGIYPSKQWHTSTETRTATMSIPVARLAEPAREARAIAAFGLPGTDEGFTVAISLWPRDGTGKVDAVSAPTVTVGKGCSEDALAQELQGRPGGQSKLRLTTVKVAVSIALQEIRGSWVNVVQVNCVSLERPGRKLGRENSR